MPTASGTAPVLSTPDDHILHETLTEANSTTRTPASKLFTRYEVQRTAAELIAGGWTCIALQFPDSLLQDAPRIVELLQQELANAPLQQSSTSITKLESSELETSLNEISLASKPPAKRRLYILGDTSYGACCVDEIAAEHISAEVVVHYGRACLSPTARLPVIHVFTQQDLDHEDLIKTFKETYPDKEAKIVLMADVMFSSHLSGLHSRLETQEMYRNVHVPSIVHDPSSAIPNRTLPRDVSEDKELLKQYAIFHISTPPTALLLTLSSRVGKITIYPTDESISTSAQASTASLLRRRYGLLTSLSAVSVFGILINTLSVSNYQSVAVNISSRIKAAGRKSYTFVVGKINAAKVANFAEIGGWVVVGCWESSLVEGDAFWKPVITPFELELVLRGDKARVWTGEWSGGFDSWLVDGHSQVNGSTEVSTADDASEDYDASNDESAPPEFDLRTGRYVSHSQPLATNTGRSSVDGKNLTALSKRSKGDMAVIGKEVSPGAEFLRTQRTWRGLGSDIQIEYDNDGNESNEGAVVEQGRGGVARGYSNEQEHAI